MTQSIGNATRRRASDVVRRRLERAFRQHLRVSRARSRQLISGTLLNDRAYELHCLTYILSTLQSRHPGTRFVLSQGSRLAFRIKGGRVDRQNWPYIQAIRNGILVWEVWPNIEFVTASARAAGRTPGWPTFGDTHELDIVVLEPNSATTGFPVSEEIVMGVEAKFRPYNKELLKQLLGVRAEMCQPADVLDANGNKIPNAVGYIRPASRLFAFSPDAAITRYGAPSALFDISLHQLNL